MSNDPHDDKRVSAAYKDLAQERAPEHLNRNILAKAAGAARKPAYSRWMAWSRPIAWAATITLCLAISFELLRDPAMDVSIEANSPAAVPVIEERKRDDVLATDSDHAREPVLVRDQIPATEEISPSFRPADMEMQQGAAEATAESAVKEKSSLARSASKQSFNEPAPARVRAENTRLMSGEAMTDIAEADESTCPAETRANASDWLDCILELEAAGLEGAAATERELLIDTFPDFNLP
jgi:hypothetical protein